MVMFNCNRCSAAMKKKDVENHSFKCGGKSNINVTCIDCLKDFRGNAYESHTSCLTEDQRYGGTDAASKPTGQKQNQWLGIVKEVLKQKDSLETDVLQFLKSVQHSQNIPRNRKKFQNWARSAKHITDTKFLDKVFDILQAEFNKTRQTDKADKSETSVEKPVDRKEANDDGKSAEIDDSSTSKGKKSKKRKSAEVENGNAANDDAEIDDINGEKLKIDDSSTSKTKKSKKRKSSEVENGNTANGNVANDDAEIVGNQNGEKLEIDDSLTPKTKKSKKRKSSEVENGNTAGDDAEIADNKNGEKVENECESETKLSKKERKLLKKKAKYELEVKEIENAVTDDPIPQEEVEPGKKSKKSKKRKLAEVDENVEKVDDSKKRKVEGDNEVETGDSPLNGDSPGKKKTKFNWHEMIVEVVKQSKNQEISLKKLSKKVVNEYISRFGDIGIQEKLQAKLNKKVNHCPGIKVLKDRAKLVERED
ncbi:Ly1 antibody reactive homolog (mouse) [Nesidiocoris tenuis]|uniref:Ly1 antibody reactive homolog (Mouse) n=1 Tax=Nesidiocoris tenuis TaxID=355587 RepID=A0ABN7B7H9_9HEMI|nr:Ly1 antibody reactive homolog (mouse) [Nesidiocoris tenuis]